MPDLWFNTKINSFFSCIFPFHIQSFFFFAAYFFLLKSYTISHRFRIVFSSMSRRLRAYRKCVMLRSVQKVKMCMDVSCAMCVRFKQSTRYIIIYYTLRPVRTSQHHLSLTRTDTHTQSIDALKVSAYSRAS